MIIIQFYVVDNSITTLYLVIFSTIVKACIGSGSEQDNTLQSDNSPRDPPNGTVV